MQRGAFFFELRPWQRRLSYYPSLFAYHPSLFALSQDIFYEPANWFITPEDCCVLGCDCEPYYRVEKYDDTLGYYAGEITWFTRGLEADVLWSRWLSLHMGRHELPG